jgi:endonuclease/exonuclease/phosphatase family metal-dependent hydrolase
MGIQLARKKQILIFRFVSGVTGELCAVGVCIPWRDAHVRTGRKDRKSWEDHLKYLECLPTVIDQYQGDAQPVVIAGDLNQRIPRQTQPQHVYGMLEQILLENYEVVTSGYRDDIGGYLIDHIATDGRCSAKTESIIPMNTEDGERLSDHHGVVAKIIRKMAP